MYGPVGGLACHNGKVYVSHRDRNGFGVITAFDYYGGHRTVVSGLPAQGEYGVTQLAVRTPTARTASTSASAPPPTAASSGWTMWRSAGSADHPEVCDKLGRDQVRTNGQRFDTPNPAAAGSGSELAVTGPFQPFNVSNQTLIRKPHRQAQRRASARSRPAAGRCKVEATGIHNPRGLAFSQFGLYFTNDGMEPRGTRPIMNDPDALLLLGPGHRYGWPDYSTRPAPVTEPRHFQPPDVDGPSAPATPTWTCSINRQASDLVDPPVGQHAAPGGVSHPVRRGRRDVRPRRQPAQQRTSPATRSSPSPATAPPSAPAA